MSKTILVIVGIACAVITAAGIMHFKSPNAPASHICIDYATSDTNLKDSYESLAPLFTPANEKAKEASNKIIKLRQQLNDKDHLIRLKALNALYTIGGKSASYEIAESLKDDNSLVREVAIWALKQPGPDESIPIVKELLSDEDERVRDNAELILYQLGVPDSEMHKLKEAGTKMIEFTGTVTEIVLEKQQENSNRVNFNKHWIVRVKVHETDTDDSVIQPGKEAMFLVHNPGRVFFYKDATNAVGKYCNFRLTRKRNEKGKIMFQYLETIGAIVNLRRQLHDKDPSIRKKALAFIVRIRDTKSIPEIKKLLNSEYEWMRNSAEWALKELGVPEEEIEDAKRNNKPEGIVRTYYESGELLSENNYKDGKREGIGKWYHESGKLLTELNYKDGKQEGIRKEYYESGKLRGEENYKDGKLEGISKEYYESGKVKGEVNYKDGKREGIAKWYYESGHLKNEINFKAGLPDGIARSYDKNGKLRFEMNYKDGIKDGIARLYDENGKLIKEQTYKDGVLIDTKK